MISIATKPKPPIRIRRRQPASKPPELAPSPSPEPASPAPRAGLEAVVNPGPRRITFHRTKGFRMPEGTVFVTRQGQGLWGNPFAVEDAPETPERPYRVVWCGLGCGARRPMPLGWRPIPCVDRRTAQIEAVAAFLRWIIHPNQSDVLRGVRTHLRGKDLACFCSQASPCHADVLLELANGGVEAIP